MKRKRTLRMLALTAAMMLLCAIPACAAGTGDVSGAVFGARREVLPVPDLINLHNRAVDIIFEFPAHLPDPVDCRKHLVRCAAERARHRDDPEPFLKKREGA